MVSISNAPADPADTGNRILEAAASCVVDFGVHRVTLAEIARRAGVSRPTVYRRWPDTGSIVSDLMTTHIVRTVRDVPAPAADREALVQRIVTVADRLREDDLVMTVLRSDMAMVYIAERLGRSQQIMVEALADWLRVAQREGSVRAGDPYRLAAMVLLITQSTIQSAHIVRTILDGDALTEELTYTLNGYLS